MSSGQDGGRPIALDANLMLTVDVRRLLCSMQELTGDAVYMTRRVFREVWGRCVDTSLRAVNRANARAVESGGTSLGHQGILSLAAEVAESWRSWMLNERARSDGAWRYVTTPRRQVEKLQIAALGSGALEEGPKKADDALVIAEAVLSGAHILASRDTGTIDHEILNGWAADMRTRGDPMFKRIPDDFIMTPDIAARRVCKDLGGAAMGDVGLRWAVGACRPKSDVPSSVLDQSIRMFLNRTQEHMPDTTAAVRSCLDAMQAHDPRWHEVVKSYPLALRTRATEDRRVASTPRMP